MKETKITVSKKKIRELLAKGELIQLSGSDASNRHCFQSLIYGYLKQRKRAAQEMSDQDFAFRLIGSIHTLQQRFHSIEKYSYWRHCLELVKAEPLILQTLPSSTGHHKKIAATIFNFLNRKWKFLRLRKNGLRVIRRFPAVKTVQMQFYGF